VNPEIRFEGFIKPSISVLAESVLPKAEGIAHIGVRFLHADKSVTDSRASVLIRSPYPYGNQ
jgi:hypothetical protein